MVKSKKVLIVTGPTGIGKTDFVLKLGQTFPSEIINADMGQMYVPLTIGTAKPDWQNESIAHHLFDILAEPQDFSMIAFREKIAKLVPEIWARGKTPIIVGGSTMYIKSLFYAPAQNLLLDQVARPITGQELNQNKQQDLWAELAKIDPLRASQIHQHDYYRIARALDIWRSTNILPSECVPKYAPLFSDMTIFFLDAPKTVLYQRIDARVLTMLKSGWLAEVTKLDQKWQTFLKHKKIIGYEVLLSYLNQEILDFDTCVKIIQQRVRNYAKRQQTFWRGLQQDLLAKLDMHKKVFKLDLTLLDLDLYIKQFASDLKESE